MESSSPSPPATIVRPPPGWQAINLRELWASRELLYFLIWRDVKVRYKQTLLGAAWAILQPLMLMVVFTIFFGRLAGVPAGDLPYPVFVYLGLHRWRRYAMQIDRDSRLSGAGSPRASAIIIESWGSIAGWTRCRARCSA